MSHSVSWVSSVQGSQDWGICTSQGLSSKPVLCDGSVLWRAGKHHGDQVEFIKQQRGRGWRAEEGSDGQKDEANTRVGGRCDGNSARQHPAWLCNADTFCSSRLPPPPHRENGKERRGGAEGATLVQGSEGSDVVECVVQLLADGLVFHLLCIDFIWGSRGGEPGGSMGRGNGGKEERKERG